MSTRTYVPLPGDIIAEKYKVLEPIGEGGMGVVVAASHMHLEQPVAIKILRPDALARPETIARFVREARTTMKLRSEHVVRVFDVGMIAGSIPFIVMELLEGRDLASLVVQEGALPITDAVDYVLQACESVAEAHALGIVHRDLKPANLFLTTRPDGSPSVKVLDFGVSKVDTFDEIGTITEPSGAGAERERSPSIPSDDALTQTNATLGSPRYMAPEQVRSARDVDTRADIWALGMILYEMLSGRSAFSGESESALSNAIEHADPPALRGLRPSLPSSLERTVMRCLKKMPGDRFADVGELAAAIAPFGGANAEQSATRTIRTLHGAHAPTFRRKRALGVPLLGFVAIAGISGLVFFGRPTEKTPAPASAPTATASASASITALPPPAASSAPSLSTSTALPTTSVRSQPPRATATTKASEPAPSSSTKPRLDPGHAFDDPE